MALTNDQITAQNFKDFYDYIYPYLGGTSKAEESGTVNVLYFNALSSAWVSTSDSGYSYKLVIPTDQFSDDSIPLWQLVGYETQNQVPVFEDIKESAKVLAAFFNTLGITLYAVDKPTVSFKLMVIVFGKAQEQQQEEPEEEGE